MIRIYRAQKDAFATDAEARSAARVYDLLHRHFAGTPTWTTDAAARATVAAGIEKAATLGMEREKDAFKITVLMMVFGPEFDRTEGWATELIAHTGGGAPDELAGLLYEAGIEQIQSREAPVTDEAAQGGGGGEDDGC